MKLEKYQGCGNDFIITNEKVDNYNELAKKLCKQHLSVGADGLIYVDYENLFVRFFNSDGSEASLCGNGLRCVACYLYNKKIFNDYLEIKTIKDKYQLILEQVDPFIVKIIFPIQKLKIKNEIINFNNHSFEFKKINIGNNQAVCVVKDLNISEKVASLISSKLKKYNLNFVKIISRDLIKVLTYEKGVGFTLSCGSGSFAAALILHQMYLVDEIVNIDVNEGYLKVNLLTNSIEGSAKKVFTIEI